VEKSGGRVIEGGCMDVWKREGVYGERGGKGGKKRVVTGWERVKEWREGVRSERGAGGRGEGTKEYVVKGEGI